MKHAGNIRHFAWMTVFGLAGAFAAMAQIDFSGMINGVVGEVQDAVNDAFDRARGWSSARPQGDRDMGRRADGTSSEVSDYPPSSETPSYGGYGASSVAAAPSQGAPQPIAGQDNAFSLDFGGGTASEQARAAARAQGGETVTVKGRGMGTNREEALKDAYRDAIERAVGMYVDAEQMMKNEELVQDQILTHSNAYIERYDVTKEETRPNGLAEIQILAVVNRSALTKKLSEVMPSQTFQVGSSLQDLHAQSVTTQKRGEDAVALLQNVLKDANPITQLMKVSLSPVKPQIRKAKIDGEEKERVYFRLNVTVDEQKYFGEFLPSLLAGFDQIALERPKTILLQARFESEDDYQQEQKTAYLAGNYKEEISLNGYISGDNRYSNRDGAPMGEVELGNADYNMGYELTDLGHGYLEKQGLVHAVVITKMNDSRSFVQARHYRLPMECWRLFEEWDKRVCGYHDVFTGKTTSYNVLFSDGTGEVVAAFPVTFLNMVLCNFGIGDSQTTFGKRDGYRRGLYLTPMVSMNAKSRERWVGFDIPRELLPEIKSVKIELAE